MKELILKVREQNWSMMGPGDWDNTEWTIYNDCSVDIKVSYWLEEKEEKIYSYTLSKENYQALLENIKLAKENTDKVDAYDGSVWELIQYENNNEIWRRDLGYIYNIKPLETISSILNDLIEEEI